MPLKPLNCRPPNFLQYGRAGSRSSWKDRRVLKLVIITVSVVGIALLFNEGWRKAQSSNHGAWTDAGRNIRVVWRESFLFDDYRGALISYTASKSADFRDLTPAKEGVYYEGKKLTFPEGSNLAIIRPSGTIDFVSLSEKYFIKDSTAAEVSIFGLRYCKKFRSSIDLGAVARDFDLHDIENPLQGEE